MRALLFALLATAAAPALADTLAITGGTLAIGDGSAPIPHGTVVIRDGRVVAAGAAVPVPAGARTLDATGKWVAAGLVAGFTSEGIQDGEGIDETDDSQAKASPFNAAIAGGVTRAVVAPVPGRSVFGGQGAVIDLGADPDPVTRARAFQFVDLSEDAAELAGGSRPAAWAMLRDALAEAADYRRDPAGFGGREQGSLVKRADAQALLPVLDGRVPLMVHVERRSDILQVLTLKRDHPQLRLVLEGVTEGWMVAREIAAARVPVIAAALADLPATFDSLAATESNVGRMERAGVQVGIAGVDVSIQGGQRLLKQFAGNLVAISRVPGHAGLDWGHAFAAITSGPAAALGMDNEIGSLRPGRRADVVLWDGDPLELASAPVAVWIDGVAQPITNRQTRLRDRYLHPEEGALPKAYER